VAQESVDLELTLRRAQREILRRGSAA